MTARFLPLLMLAMAAPAAAADRVVSVGSFERVRIDGPFEVRIVAGASPGATLSGDRDLIERIAVRHNGATLTVRLGTGGWGERFAARQAVPPRITLSTPRLTHLAISAGARITANRMTGQQVAVSIHGAGSLTVERIDTDQLTASLLGSGTLSAGGQANRARLTSDGTGTIDAAGVTVKDLEVQLNGLGEIAATARQTARVTTSGLGKVTVKGPATCTVRAVSGGPVICGSGR